MSHIKAIESIAQDTTSKVDNFKNCKIFAEIKSFKFLFMLSDTWREHKTIDLR